MSNHQDQEANIVKKLYRRPDKGLIFGVCAGIADYWQMPVLWVRLFAVVALFAGLFLFTVIIYCALAALLDLPPITLNQQTQQQWQQISQQLAENEQRLRRLEQYLTSSTYATENDFRQL